MIVGNINQLSAARAEFPAAIYTVLAAIRQMDFSRQPDGEMRDGEVVYKTFQANTAPSEARIAEIHQDNIDVQFVITGQERLEYQPVLSLTPDDPQPAQDNYFFHPKTGAEKALVLNPGDFVVLFPWDIHTPLCQIDRPEAVRKLVAKVPVSLLSRD